MEELGSNGIKIYTFPNEQPVGELNSKMNVSNNYVIYSNY